MANEIFLDVDPVTRLQTGVLWKDALRRASTRCEAVICLLSPSWEASHETPAANSGQSSATSWSMMFAITAEHFRYPS